MISRFQHSRQAGLSLVELMVSIAISLTVLGGVVQVLVVSKNNFVSERELAALQENARFAMKFLTEELRMAGYTGCTSKPLYYANSVNGSSNSLFTDNSGLQGYEYDAGIATFPSQFSADVAANTDAFLVRRGNTTGLALSGNHQPASANIPLNKTHAYTPGMIMMIASPNCEQVGIFQISNPQNSGGNASNIVHNTGGSTSPGNCTKALGGQFDCSNTSGSASTTYSQGSRLMEMYSAAFYVGVSSTDSTVPALHREYLIQSGTGIGTQSEELVQGVENMQLLYGLDNALDDGIADIYVKADSGVMDWDNVVSVRLSIRMRSVNPVYNENVAYPVFEGVSGTDGSDRFLRQTLSTTVKVRNL